MVLEDCSAVVYEYCGETPRSVHDTAAHLRSTMDKSVTECGVRRVLEDMKDAGLIVAYEGEYLSLACPRYKRYAQNELASQRG
jgi:hypothetical protein